MPESCHRAIRAILACAAFASASALAAPPDPPDIPMAQAGNTTATVTIDPPANDGGSPITGYTVTSNPPGGVDAAAGTLTSPRVITGLTNGVQYTFTAIAINADGPSAASLPSIDVRPAFPTATITVDSMTDDGVGCTLRKAIENANGILTPHVDCAIGGLENTIVFSGNGTILLDSANNELFVSDRPLTIQGNGAANTIIDGQHGVQIFDLCGCIPLTFTLTGVTLTRGTDAFAFNPGAAIYGDIGVTLRIRDSIIRDSEVSNAGAVFSVETVEIERTVFIDNTSVGPGALGGAVAVAGSGTITGSLFTGNSAVVGGAIMYGGFVGTSLTVTHSTFTGNTASDIGGAIAMMFGDAALTLTHVTIVGNTAVTSGGGVFNGTIGSFNIGSSIVANNTAPVGADCDILATPVTSQDYNVFGPSATCGVAANDVSANPVLLALANNGGPTMTMKPGPTSPARDRAPCAAMTDQRGIARPQGPACESGAFEIRLPDAPTAPVATAGDAQATVTFAGAGAGDGTLSGFTAISNPVGGLDPQAGTMTIPRTLTGLANGTPYTFTAVATSEYGNGPPSGPSNSVTPTAVIVPGIKTYTAPSATGSGTITATFTGGGVPCGYTVSRYIPVTGHVASPPIAPPASVTFPHGLFDFTVGGCTPGSAIAMTITYATALPAGTQYWKFGPTPTNATPHWYTLPATVAGNTVTFTIVDGQLGDDDLVANGTIVDQGGPGIPGSPGTATAVPTLSEWMLMLLATLMLSVVILTERRRRKDLL